MNAARTRHELNMHDSSDDAFWRFSIGLYAQPGVAPRCLELQDRFGVDVNVLLFCLHAGASGRALQPADIAALEQAVGAWREQVVAPLRGVRRWLKSPPAPFDDPHTAGLREGLKRIELESERLQQMAMARVLSLAGSGDAPTAEPEAASTNNLARYLATLMPTLPDVAIDASAALLHIAHPGQPAAAHAAALRQAFAIVTSSPQDRAP